MVGFNSHTRYVLIIVHDDGDRIHKYDTDSEAQAWKIIAREKKKPNVKKITLGAKVVYERK